MLGFGALGQFAIGQFMTIPGARKAGYAGIPVKRTVMYREYRGPATLHELLFWGEDSIGGCDYVTTPVVVPWPK